MKVFSIILAVMVVSCSGQNKARTLSSGGEKGLSAFGDKILQTLHPKIRKQLKFSPAGSMRESYLIEFSEPSLFTKRQALQMEKSIGLLSGSIDSKVKAHRESLITAQAAARRAIEKQIGKRKFVHTFQSSFNGAVIELTQKELAKVRKIKGIKRVTLNRQVESTVSDSASVTNIDIVRTLNASGNSCSETETPCLSGKGTKIAVIDTGVDYSHPDLNSLEKVIRGKDFWDTTDLNRDGDYDDCYEMDTFNLNDCNTFPTMKACYDWIERQGLRCEIDMLNIIEWSFNIDNHKRDINHNGIYLDCHRENPKGRFCESESDPDPMDKYFHGTHVASIAAAGTQGPPPSAENFPREFVGIPIRGVTGPVYIKEEFPIGCPDYWWEEENPVCLQVLSHWISRNSSTVTIFLSVKNLTQFDVNLAELKNKILTYRHSFSPQTVPTGWRFSSIEMNGVIAPNAVTEISVLYGYSAVTAFTGMAPKAQVVAYRVLGPAGYGTFADAMAAVELATDPNQDGDTSDRADIINLSLGADCGGVYDDSCGPDDPQSLVIDAAVASGSVVAVSAGNSGPGLSTVGSPGTARSAITVGATFKKSYEGTFWGAINPLVNQLTNFSSRGPVQFGLKQILKPDVVAPGAIVCAARIELSFLGDNTIIIIPALTSGICSLREPACRHRLFRVP
ncbi:MAG: S8 family serine peptidase [Deltaproteobacteria bacterium]|nr:S8 family serine peptidase [Deltaproteobacteria bacterium]